MIDPTEVASYRLGKLRVMHDPRTFRLEAILRDFAPPPPAFDGSQGITDWGMMANNQVGDCTAAAAGHLEMVWSKEAGEPVTFSDADILDLYGRCNNGGDNGAVELFVLREWRHNGLAGRKIHAYAAVNLVDQTLVRQATSIFSGLYIGVALPLTAQGQGVWDDTGGQDPRSQPGSWGGHAVPVIGYDLGGLSVVSWGRVFRMTWNFWSRYAEEAWAVIPENFAASALDFTKLDAQLAQVSAINP